MARYIYLLLFFLIVFCSFSGEQDCLQQSVGPVSNDYLAESTTHKGTYTRAEVFDINLLKDTNPFRVSEFGKRLFPKKAIPLPNQDAHAELFIKLAINSCKTFIFKCLTGAAIVFPFHYFF